MYDTPGSFCPVSPFTILFLRKISPMSDNNRETLGSRIGFLLLTAGCAIGLGNIWRFPYITGKYGGACFVAF